jgi:hypothetical protein
VDPDQRRQYDAAQALPRGFNQGFNHYNHRNDFSNSNRSRSNFHSFRDPFDIFEDFLRHDDMFEDMMKERFRGFGSTPFGRGSAMGRSPFGRHGSIFDNDPFFSDHFGQHFDQHVQGHNPDRRGSNRSSNAESHDVLPRRSDDGGALQFRFGGGNGSVTGKSVSTSTVIKNGRKHVVKRTTIRKADGSEETNVEEYTE